MRGPRRLQHEVPQGFRPCLAGGISQHEVHAAKLVWFLPSVPRVKLAEEPPDLRLLPDLAFDKFIQHAFEPRAAASGGAEDPDHVLRVHARRLLAPFKATSQPGASESRSVVPACRAEIDGPLSVGLRFTAPFMRVSLSNFEASLETVGAMVCTMLASLLCHLRIVEKGCLWLMHRTS